MPEGIKHTISCLCVLPQFRKRANPPFHQFVVFSVIDDSDTIEPKLVECNNCGVIHSVIDLCKSEVITSRDELSVLTKKDIGYMLPQQVSELLESYGCDLPTWEQALFILNEKKWNSFLVLDRSTTDEGSDGKILRFKNENKYMIEPFIDRRSL
jgi:hypothetical protein